MSFYARRPSRLLGQLTADLFMIAWVVLVVDRRPGHGSVR